MKIKSSLSASGIDQIIAQVSEYRKNLQAQKQQLVSNLVSAGVEYAKSDCPVGSGTLYDSIVGIMDNTQSKGFIRVDCPYAIYVEMGTGIKGARHPHPDKTVIGFGFSYDRNGHGDNGWWYPTTAKDPNPTKYTAKDGTMYAWTKGMPSRPFMYNAAQQLKDEIRG